jgi:hypothetical protein
MKLLRTSALAIFTTVAAQAQTNTFPASGNVGIGTTSPGQALDLVRANETVALRFHIPGIVWYTMGIDAVDGYKFKINGAGSLDSGMNRLTLDGSGNFGIATTTPSSRLSVNGNINADSFNATGGVQQFYADGGVYLAGHGGSPYAALQAYSNNAGAGKSLALNPSGGNVGIGTTAPSQKFTVVTAGGAQKTQIQFGASYATAGSSSSALTFLGWGIEHAGINWTPNGTLSNGRLDFNFGGSEFPGDNTTRVSFLASGNVGIGTTNPTHKLAVNGTIKAKEVIVETTGWSDYVFADDYALQPLAQVEAHIKEHKHLPGIPSASTVASNGVNVGDMQAALLAKVEELTLHLIAQEKELARLRETERDVAALRAEVRQLRQTK